MNNIDPINFANYLGVDYKRTGGLVRIVCPFHNDTDPSMVLYEDHAYCYACGQGASLPWLASQVKNIPYPKALEELGMEVLPPSAVKAKSSTPTFRPLSFCERPKEIHAKAFRLKHEQCRTIEDIVVNGPDTPETNDLITWLDKKKLLDVAMKLDWRWHDGTVFKHWGKGIVIPYKVGEHIVYERFRAWLPNEHKFDKPISPCDITIQPYFAAFRPNDTIFIVEGESDAASVYAHGCSAIGVPGAVAKKAINTAIAFVADRDFITTIVCCGDNDDSGQRMNTIIHEAVMEMCPRKKLITYTVETEGSKSDVNDDHANGLFHPPIEYTANYRDNYDRQPWADKEFSETIDRIEKEWAEKGDDFWTSSENRVVQEVSNQPDTAETTLLEPNLPNLEIFEPRYHDMSVLCLKAKIERSPNHFYVHFTKGTYKGQTYEITPEVAARGWEEDMKLPSGKNSRMFCVHFHDMVRKI